MLFVKVAHCTTYFHFTVLIEIDETIEWIKFNVDQVGYYRVNYRSEEWDTLRNLLQYAHKVFTFI